jgi:hypothetical protein
MTEPNAIGSPREGCDMMTAQQAAEHLRVIRELMERPVRDTTRSGLAGILAGLLALAGCFATWTLWTDLPNGQPPLSVAAVWLGVLVLASVGDILITWHRASRGGRTYWKRAQFQTALAIVPGFILAGFFSYLFSGWEAWSLIGFGWMVGYGMALWTVGMFSIVEIKVLGAAFLVAGWLGMFLLPDYPVVAMAVTFGGFHLAYGLVVLKRHGG